MFFFFKQKTAYEMRISDWSSDVCSSDLLHEADGPTHLAVILDHSSESFRNQIYDQYKANRPEPPEDLIPQFPLIRDATRAFSLPCIEMEGFEADDLIASYAEAAVREGWDVTIVSSDKDLMQLIREPVDGSPHVDMLDTMKNVRLGMEAVNEKFGVTTDLVGDVLALMGDSVDNVPGVRGVGPKTATKPIPIGRASCRDRVGSTCSSRWTPAQ